MSKLHILAGMTAEDEKMFFATALEHHLRRQGRGAISALAADTGLSQPQISRIRNGESMGSVDARIKIATALGTNVEQMLILGRSLKSGERRSGIERRSIERRVGDSNEALGYPHLRELAARFPSVRRYVEMAELAAAENDFVLVLSLLRTVLEKFEEEIRRVQSTDSGDDSLGVGGRG
jgi:transcriptional regulator with XRE-family HTH domain